MCLLFAIIVLPRKTIIYGYFLLFCFVLCRRYILVNGEVGLIMLICFWSGAAPLHYLRSSPMTPPLRLPLPKPSLP